MASDASLLSSEIDDLLLHPVRKPPAHALELIAVVELVAGRAPRWARSRRTRTSPRNGSAVRPQAHRTWNSAW
jgi:hypothetical protein